tara:strand:+ start:2273 stop:2956 length:684 start_codon:yes stop_codon:yes gene_type:complete
MKIHIFYRHFDISGTDGRRRPQWFDFEKCFKNLLNTIEGTQVNLNVIFDGHVEKNWIDKYKDKFTTHEIKAGGDQSSFFQTWEIVKNSNIEDNDLIYFLENDYLHLEGWVDKVVELFEKYDLLHYISTYDHNDKYFANYDDLVSKIFITDTHHWRTTPSTCGSFIINRKLFDLDYDIHTTVVGDHNKFIDLYNNRQRMVITPIPGLSTHCVDRLLSPTIDWEKINKK